MSASKTHVVTGGAGFIGSHLVEALVHRGDRVRVFDSLVTGDRSNLAGVRDDLQFIKADIRNGAALRKAFRGADTVFHLAALRSVERSVHQPLATDEVNAHGTLQVLVSARAAGVRRVVFSSSSSVYGLNKTYPQVEALRAMPVSPYAVSKLTGELYCTVFAETFQQETAVLRYFNVFGPRQHADSQYACVLPKFMEAAVKGVPLEVHSDGKQSRDFTYVKNVVQANLLASRAPNASGEVFNIACGRPYSLLEIIRELEKLVGHKLPRKHGPMRAGDVRRTWADISKAKRLLKYKPDTSFPEGLAKSWEWFQAHGA